MTNHPEKLNKRKSRIVGRLAAENRRFTRGKLPLKGRFLAENGWEYPLVIKDISPGGILIHSDYVPKKGQQIVMMVAELGRLQAKVLRTTENGFACMVLSTARKRDQLADKLTWLLNFERLGLHDDRSTARKPSNGEVYVQLLDGTRFVANAIDVSVSGMSIQSPETVRIAERVSIGKLSGTVTRILNNGFAIRFDPPCEPNTKEEEEKK